jgi:hypothetical protein
MKKLMQMPSALLLCAVVVQASLVTPSFASDKKIVGGGVCQPENPQDSANLRYFARGVQAIGKDVLVNCYITRDNSASKLRSINVRYQRSFDPIPQGQPKFSGTFTGTIFSCGNLEIGNPCTGKSGESPPGGNDPTSVSITVGNALPHDDNRYYVYKSKIPEGTVLKSLTYVEED